MSDMSNITTEWMTSAEAAKEIGCSPATVLRLARAGSIERFVVNPRLYLVKRADVEAEKTKGQSFGRPRGS
jgi:excisionase family DNA binding protein